MRPHRVGLIGKLRATAGFIGIVKNWGDHYIATHGSAQPRRLIYRLRNGLQLEARPRTLDVAVLKDVFYRRVYGPPGFQIEDGFTVLDIGAHLGAFAASAARAACGVKVFAFEPAPENFTLLSSNMARNGLSNVQLSQEAVAGAAGTRALHLSESPAEHSFHIVKPGGAEVPVASVTLAEVARRHGLETVDFLKMDCEGAEYEILETAARDGLAFVRRIAMEAHVLDASRTPGRLCTLLQDQGFLVRTGFEGDSTTMIWARRG